MTDIYTKSLKLMDEYFDSISDEKFLEDYLAVEDSHGPTVEEYLYEYSSLKFDYSFTSPLSLDIEIADMLILHVKNKADESFDTPYASNDCDYCLAA